MAIAAGLTVAPRPAEDAALRAENRERRAARVMVLQRMVESVHELAHATGDALAGGPGGASALARMNRRRARLRALLDNAPTGVSLPNCETIASGAGGAGTSPDFPDALAELETAIASEQRHIAE